MRAGPLKRSKKSLWIAAAAVAATQVPSAAKAAGIDVPENGAAVLARGGTYSSLLDTAYSLQFNPAGMTEINGLDVRIDARWVGHDVAFKRSNTATLRDAALVENKAPPFFGPGFAVAYRHPTKGLLGKFAFGIGAWGPAGVGKYSFPDPSDIITDFKKKNSKNPDDPNYNPTYDDDLNDAVAKGAPQRYSQVKSDIFIAYPTIGIAFQPHEKFSIGASFQLVYASVEFSQALGVNMLPGSEGEQPQNDAFVKLKTSRSANPFDKGAHPTTVLGATFKPMKGLILNASFRPKVYIEAPGTVEVTLPEGLKSLASIEGNQATLGLNLAPILRIGGSYKRDRLSTAAEFVYEGWSANDQFKVATKVKVVPKVGDPSEVGTLYIKNGWKDTFGGRIGAGYDIFQPEKDKFLLQANAGALFETNAVPSSAQAVPFVSGNRGAFSGGVTVAYKGFGLTASGMYYIPVNFTVTDSTQAQGVSNPEKVNDQNRVVVGNGDYTSKVWVAAIGLSYTGLGSAK